MYKVFHNIVRVEEITPENAVEMPLADVYSEVFALMREDREFFGLIDSNDTTLQAMYHQENDEYWFEVPRVDLEGSFGRYLSFDGAVDLIKSLDGPFPLEGFEGFEFQSWQRA